MLITNVSGVDAAGRGYGVIPGTEIHLSRSGWGAALLEIDAPSEIPERLRVSIRDSVVAVTPTGFIHEVHIINEGLTLAENESAESYATRKQEVIDTINYLLNEIQLRPAMQELIMSNNSIGQFLRNIFQNREIIESKIRRSGKFTMNASLTGSKTKTAVRNMNRALREFGTVLYVAYVLMQCAPGSQEEKDLVHKLLEADNRLNEKGFARDHHTHIPYVHELINEFRKASEKVIPR